MDASAAFQFHSVVGFSMSLSFSKQRYLGNSCISMKEVAVQVQPSPFATQRAISPFNSSSIRSDEGDKGVQTSRKNEGKRTKTFIGQQPKSPDHEEILALIKRTRLSISRGYSQKTGNRGSNAENEPSTESNRDILEEPKKQVKAGNVSNRAKQKHLPERIAQSMKRQDHQHVSGFMLTRTPSNFVRKSPIPFLSPTRGNTNDDASPTTTVDEKVQPERLEEMRLPELKELAKTRGVKGYSKLKKGELIKILGS